MFAVRLNCDFKLYYASRGVMRFGQVIIINLFSKYARLQNRRFYKKLCNIDTLERVLIPLIHLFRASCLPAVNSLLTVALLLLILAFKNRRGQISVWLASNLASKIGEAKLASNWRLIWRLTFLGFSNSMDVMQKITPKRMYKGSLPAMPGQW